LISLAISLIEIQISTRALNLELSDMEELFEKRASSLEGFFRKDNKKEND
jgi:hypothetical protein